uniref:Class I peptide chain release factor n=2 Tax=unclassified Mycobacterium TaxID=2642494 RepID=A0A5Q5BJV4_MYCSS
MVSTTLVIAGSELSERFSRSSGPGGQGVNTADSRVELSLDLLRSRSIPQHLRHRMLSHLRRRLTHGVLTVTASEHRAQLQNRAAARERMARLLRDAAAAPPPTRRPTRPTRGSKERRITEKKRRGTIKEGRRGGWGPN